MENRDIADDIGKIFLGEAIAGDHDDKGFSPVGMDVGGNMSEPLKEMFVAAVHVELSGPLGLSVVRAVSCVEDFFRKYALILALFARLFNCYSQEPAGDNGREGMKKKPGRCAGPF
jgi:hypothetical protein